MRPAMRPVDWTPPEQFHEYRIVKLLGRGAMGQVFLAQDTYLDRPVALKFIAQVAPDGAARERFLVEARAAARLHHPNVVAVYRVGELGSRPYLVSEFVRGKSLDQLAKPMPWRQAWEIGLALARGLAAAHRRGVLHRDIKPANAMLTDDGEVKLLDFGLAKLLEAPGTMPALRGIGTLPPTNGKAKAPNGKAVQAPKPDDDALAATMGTPPPRNNALEATMGTVQELPAGDTLEETCDFVDPDAKSALEISRPERADLTEAGAFMGTPYYMSPESWRGEPATRRSDVYSLGVLIYELVAGKPPNRGASWAELLEIVVTRDTALLVSKVPDCDPRFAAVVDRCLRRDPDDRFASGDTLREALEALAPSKPIAIPAGNPYRGLAAFEAEHRAVFFGRGLAIRQVVERLRTEPFVVVAGESGVGKSSVCRAGVIPSIVEGAFGAGRDWEIVRLVPGKHPVASLSAALAPTLGSSESDLAKAVRSDPATLGRELRARLGAERGLVILFDQLEELVTLADPAEADVIAEVLAALATPNPSVRVLGTVRGDFLGQLARFPSLCDEVSRGLVLLGPLGPDGVREAIVGPARSKGVHFESDAMIDQLVAAASRDGALPLLQFALAELWEAHDETRNVITDESLASIGGVAGALARHADGVLASLAPTQRTAARHVLVKLVTSANTRARRTEQELGSDGDTASALAALVRGRLLAIREADGETAYEVAHEALISEWSTLRDWLSNDVERRAAKERLTQAVIDWDRLGRPRDALWGDRQLAESAAALTGELSPSERLFVDTSRRRTRLRRWIPAITVISVALVVASVYGGVRLSDSRDLAQKVDARLVIAREILSSAAEQAVRLDARRAEAFAKFDRYEGEAAELVWARAIEESAALEKTYADASQKLEEALILDGTRRHVMGELANVLYLRAILAERERPTAQMNEHVERLKLYDVDGRFQGAWEASGALSIRTVPDQPCKTRFSRYERAGGARTLVAVETVRTTPLTNVKLAKGSYLLELSCANVDPIRYPFIVRRAEEVTLTIELPSHRLAPTLVYVPEGRFLYGSDAVEGVRKGFYFAVPQHEISVSSFAIGRYEVTYRQYIEFLEALSPEDATLRAPAAKAGYNGDVDLVRSGSTWLLTLQPTSKAFSARAGEKLHYPGRSKNAEVDWLDLPVAGIARADAVAYVSWLDTTGRVPRARLCTEIEWERAARGADDRIYPHGDVLLPDDANFDLTYGRDPLGYGPDTVGTHPTSRSPFGVEDMAGNVLEWVDSKEGYSLRGGAYYYEALVAQVMNRIKTEPTMREANVGFRICASNE